jgi:hypothetical protein
MIPLKIFIIKILTDKSENKKLESLLNSYNDVLEDSINPTQSILQILTQLSYDYIKFH